MTTAGFVVPAISGTVAVAMMDTTWLQVGKTVYIGGNVFEVVSVDTINQATVRYVPMRSDLVAPGTTIASGTTVGQGIGHFEGSFFTMTIPVKLVQVAAGSDVLTQFTPGFAFKLVQIAFAVSVPVTTGGKAITLSLKINGTTVGSGNVALTSANCTPLGKVVTGPGFGLNNGSSTDTISIVAAGGPNFSEGEGYILLFIQAYG